MTGSELKYLELERIRKFVYQACELVLTDLEVEREGCEYFAHNFKLNKKAIKFRIAKITPKKIGQFVTLWQRNADGITVPFSLHSDFDFCIIATRKETNLGMFVFSKSVLYKYGVLSDETKNGKRAIRLYPTWDLPVSKQALITQLWQSSYFIDLTEIKAIDLEKVKRILNDF